MAKRVTARIPDEVDEKVKVWSLKLGVTQSQLMGMAIQAGIDSIIRAVSPVDAMSPSQWAAIIKAMEAQGVTFEGVKVGSEELPDEHNAGD
jgi:antitoxin component of RelBE/YafQ-DinJ toxin-antitoxin module